MIYFINVNKSGVEEDLCSNILLTIPAFSLSLLKFSLILSRTMSFALPHSFSYLWCSWLLSSIAFKADHTVPYVKYIPGKIFRLYEIRSKTVPSITCSYHIYFLVDFVESCLLFNFSFAYLFYLQVTTKWKFMSLLIKLMELFICSNIIKKFMCKIFGGME